MPRDRDDRWRDEEDDDRPRRRREEDDEEDDRPRRRRDDDDGDDRPRRSRRRRDDDDFDRRPAPQGNALAVTSLILGIVSLCLGPLTGLVGLILGLIALRKPSGRVMAIIGLVLSGLFSFGYIGVGVWAYFEGQKVQKGRNNLLQIGLATHNYESAYAQFPKPYHEEPGAVPSRPGADLSDRLSWRVTILPYVEQESVYRQFKLTEPWNSPANQPLGSTPVRLYSDAETPTDPTTRVRCFYDNGAFFDTRDRIRISGVTDGTSNTIMYVEGGDKVTWSRFQEYRFDPKGSLPVLGKPGSSTFMVVMGDMSVRSVRKSVSENTLKNAINRQDGMVLGPDW